MTYEEWKKERLERVRGRCGGRPTFKNSRLQPHDVIHDADGNPDGFMGISREDIEHAKRFCQEEPHWRMLASGTREDGTELDDSEYSALEKFYPRWDE